MSRQICTSAKAVVIQNGKLLAIKLNDGKEEWYILPGGGQGSEEMLTHTVEKLTAHLPFIKDMKTEEGKKVVWGIDELGKAEIEGKDCYLLDLRYADEEENGVMVGRRLGSYAFSQDGEQYYELNAADDSWNRI